MPTRFIVAYDGSSLAREAFAYSVMLAEKLGSSILGLHVLEPVPPPIIAESMAGVDAAPAMVDYDESARAEQDQQRDEANKQLDELEEVCGQRKIPFERLIEAGMLIPTLVDLANADDVIAIGMKGRFARAGLGSAAKSLIKKAPCPVLVASGPLRPVNRVLSVFDGSSVSKRAVHEAVELAERAQWPHTVLAIESDELTLDESLDRAQGIATEAQVVSYGAEGKNEAEQIEDAAKKAGYAILVMGAYPDSWLHQLFFGFGGTTAHVLERVGAPVLLVH